MSAIDAQDTTFTFGGAAVGGLNSWEFLAGDPQEATFRPINGPPRAFPMPPDFGRCVLKLLRDKTDPGQLKLQESLRLRRTETCVITYKDGTTETFRAFCLTLPTIGSKGMTTPVNQSTCMLRIDGAIS